MRYFIVFYISTHSTGLGYGHVPSTTEGCYLVSKSIEKQIREQIGCISLIISNIIELNKSDYDDWRGE